MRSKTLALASASWLLATAATAQPAYPAPPPSAPAASAPLRTLTLTEAYGLASSANPALRSRQAQLAAAEGLRRAAGAFLYNNPQLSTDLTRRSVSQVGGSTERHGEWSAGVSQSFEVAGQRGHRREAAEAGLQALRLEIAATERQVLGDTAERFFRVLALQQRVDLERQSVRLFDDTAGAVERRRAAGEDTRLDANVALVEAERARNQLAIAEEQLIEARAALAAQLQLPPVELPQAAGDLSPTPMPYPRGALVELALRQPRILALDAREQSAQARLRLERAARYPDVTVDVASGREGPSDARERLTTIRLSVPLPLWRHNDAAIGQATTDASQVAIERRTAIRDVESQVLAAWSRLESLRMRVERLQSRVLPILATNERLATRSRQAGQIGLLELIVTTRQSVDARRDLIDASLDYQLARAALESAAGWPLNRSNP
jgi:cobalt-zinc-cadmium efflux system outer membrane protein